MKLKDFNLLKKLMQMTLSGADAEALFALRKANELLIAEKVDWDRVLNRMVQLEVEDAAHYEHPREERDEASTIDEAFARIEADDPRGSFADFIASLKDQWDTKHSLSPKQKASLFKAAEQAGGRR